MQRYGDLGLYANIWLFSSLVCCDREADLRQRGGLSSFFVGKEANNDIFGIKIWRLVPNLVPLHPKIYIYEFKGELIRVF